MYDFICVHFLSTDLPNYMTIALQFLKYEKHIRSDRVWIDVSEIHHIFFFKKRIKHVNGLEVKWSKFHIEGFKV